MYTLQELENHMTEIRQKLSFMEKKLSLQEGYHLGEELANRFPTKREIKANVKAQKPLGREPSAEEILEREQEAREENK